MKNASSIVSSIPERLCYALQDSEQRFEWNHVGRRRAFRNLAGFPFSMIEWHKTSANRIDKKTKEPLGPLPWAPGIKDGKLVNARIKENIFFGLMLKNALDTALKFGLSTFVKSMTVGYNQNSDFRFITHTSGDLLTLAFAASEADEQTVEYFNSIKAAHDSPMHDLLTNAADANTLMMRFVSGELPPTSENLSKLGRYLGAMSHLCELHAGLPPPPSSIQPASEEDLRRLQQNLSTQAAQSLMHQAPEQIISQIYDAHRKLRPSEPLRYALTAKKITTAKEAALYFATLSALVTDGAIGISSEIYRPQDELFLTPKEALKTCEVVQRVMDRADHRWPDGETLIQMANDTKRQLWFLMPKLDRMMAFADLHYADIEGLLTDKTQQPVENQLAHITEEAGRWTKHIQTAPETPKAKKLPKSERFADSYYEPDIKPFALSQRPQARHEMWKLFGRGIPNYILQMPINYFARRIVGDKKTAAWVTWYQLATMPVSESFIGVTAYEEMRKPVHNAVAYGARMSEFLTAALATADNLDPEFRNSYREVTSHDGYRQLTARYESVLTKPPHELTPDDHRLLAQYFSELAVLSGDMGNHIYRWLTGNRAAGFDTFKQHTTDIIMKGATTLSDAMVALSLIRFMRDVADDQVLSLEYVDPKEMVLDARALQKLAEEALDVAQKHGLALAGTMITSKDGKQFMVGAEGVEPGQLVVWEEKAGRFRAAGKEDILAYVNDMLEEIRGKLLVEKWLEVTQGSLSERYLRTLEESLLGDLTLPPLPTVVPASSPNGRNSTIAYLPPEKLVTETAKASWPKRMKEHFFRPELMHEIRQLRNRQAFVSLFSQPVKMLESVLRGDVTKFWDERAWKSAAFNGIAITFATSYGSLILREMTTFKGQEARDAARDASATLTNIIRASLAAQPDLVARLRSATGLNPELATVDPSLALEHAAAILSKPASERSKEEQFYVERFAEIQVAPVIAGALGSLQAAIPQETRGMSSVLMALLTQKVERPEQAVIVLALADAVLEDSREHFNVIRFQNEKDTLLNVRQTIELASVINDTARRRNLTPESMTGEQLVAYAGEIQKTLLAELSASQSARIDVPRMEQMTQSKLAIYLRQRESAATQYQGNTI